MTLMTDADFDAFFERYAPNVEGFYEASYWRLSDELIKELVRRHLGLKPGHHVIDAGGGTGRWAMWLAGEFDVTVMVADRSERMLAEAARLLHETGNTAVRTARCDLQDAPELADSSFDAAISTYGVLSFLDDPGAAFRTLYRVLRPGAHGLFMSHSLLNALESKVSRDGASPKELKDLLEIGIVRWAPHVPPLRVFSAAQLRDLATATGFEVEAVFGVTCVTKPGKEDFGYPYTAISQVSQALEDDELFQAVRDIELLASECSEWAERGVNLMIKVRR